MYHVACSNGPDGEQTDLRTRFCKRAILIETARGRSTAVAGGCGIGARYQPRCIVIDISVRIGIPWGYVHGLEHIAYTNLKSTILGDWMFKV